MMLIGDVWLRAELGRSTWKLLHTMMARYPEEPTDEQAETLRSFVYLLSRLYPWYEVSPHSSLADVSDKATTAGNVRPISRNSSRNTHRRYHLEV